MLYNQMKQKRKAKSLISMSKVGDIVNFPRLLLTIGGLFCLAALSLFSFTIYVNAQVALQELGGQNEITETDSSGFSYSWLNDNVEVIYEANFVDPDNTYNIGGRIYMDNAWNKTNLVIQWNTFLNWENNSAPNSNRNANILWWKNNIINANNITTLWWEENIIYSDNVAVLWWKGNNISDRNISIAWGGWSIWGLGWLTIPISQQITPKVLIGSKNSNIWIAWTWSMIIWWSGNAINSKNSAILWWSENEIINVSWWIIIAWQKVNVNKTGLENVFVFSDGRTTFQPQSSNAFYLNTQKWLWLNMASNREWVDSKWAVSFWNINTITCNADNVGLVWLSGQCLYGCTLSWYISTSSYWVGIPWRRIPVYVWKSISDSKACNPKENSEPDYDGFCNGNKPDSTRTKLCDNLDPTKYVDVQFSYEIREKCPANQVWENQCVYVCKEWYSFKDGWCYKNCKLPISLWWNLVAHGTVITWYTNALPNPTCLDECKSWSMQCKDGNWYAGTKYVWNGNSRVNGFVRLYDCTTQPKTCGSEYKYSTWITNATCTACTAYDVNNNKCVKPWTTKYKCECNAGYIMKNGACRKSKCTWTLPSNTTPNNGKEPTKDTKYYYSTNKNEPCTYSCNYGYTWDGTKCKKPEPKCTNPENITNAYAVQNNNPEKTPITNTPYYYSTDNEACTFSCDNDKWRNPIKKQCQGKSNLCETTHYKCKAGATSHNQSESPEKYTWKCINNLDNSDIYQCSEIKDNNTDDCGQCSKNTLYACDEWVLSNTGFNISNGTATRKCKWANSTVKCEMKWVTIEKGCPDNYEESNGECVLKAKFCARQQKGTETIWNGKCFGEKNEAWITTIQGIGFGWIEWNGLNYCWESFCYKLSLEPYFNNTMSLNLCSISNIQEHHVMSNYELFIKNACKWEAYGMGDDGLYLTCSSPDTKAPICEQIQSPGNQVKQTFDSWDPQCGNKRQCPDTMEIPGTCTHSRNSYQFNEKYIKGTRGAWKTDIPSWLVPAMWEENDLSTPWLILCQNEGSNITGNDSITECYEKDVQYWISCRYRDIKSAFPKQTGIDGFGNSIVPYLEDKISLTKEHICVDKKGNKIDPEQCSSKSKPEPTCWWITYQISWYNLDEQTIDSITISGQNKTWTIDAVDEMVQLSVFNSSANESCKPWYHIPTTGEWNELISTWEGIVWTSDVQKNLFIDSLLLSSDQTYYNGIHHPKNDYLASWGRLRTTYLQAEGLNAETNDGNDNVYPLRCFKD